MFLLRQHYYWKLIAELLQIGFANPARWTAPVVWGKHVPGALLQTLRYRSLLFQRLIFQSRCISCPLKPEFAVKEVLPKFSDHWYQSLLSKICLWRASREKLNQVRRCRCSGASPFVFRDLFEQEVERTKKLVDVAWPGTLHACVAKFKPWWVIAAFIPA